MAARELLVLLAPQVQPGVFEPPAASWWEMGVEIPS